MTPTLVHRDERTTAFENAGYRWSYLFLSFGLLALVAYRSFARHESPWDLLALVVLGGGVGTVYQGYHRVLSRRWALISLAALLIAVLVSAALALGRGAPSANSPFETARLAAMAAVKDRAVATVSADYESAKKALDDLTAKAATSPAGSALAIAITTAKDRLDAAAKALADLKGAPVEDFKAAQSRASTAIAVVHEAIKTAADELSK